MSKLLIFFLCVLSFSAVKSKLSKQDMLSQSVAFKEECRKEVSITQAEADEITLKKIAKTKAAKCFIACNMKKYEMMDSNGKFNKTAAMEKTKILTDGNAAAFKKAAEVIEKCAKITLPSDHCEAAYIINKCFNEPGVQRSQAKPGK